MNMAHARKEMVLNLEVQASHIPGEETTVVGEIGCGIQLMYCPAVVHFSISIGNGILGAVNNVRRLKDYRQNESRYVVHDEESDHYLPPCNRKHDHRNDKNVKGVYRFG